MTHCDGIETCLNTPRCQPAQRAQNSWQNSVIFDRILRGIFVNSMIMSEKSQIVSAHGCRIFFFVTPVLASCRNQNFGRRVTHHVACRIERNTTVPPQPPPTTIIKTRGSRWDVLSHIKPHSHHHIDVSTHHCRFWRQCMTNGGSRHF